MKLILLALITVLAGAARAAEVVQPFSSEDAAAWSQYDFVPGEKLLFFDDFSRGLTRLKNASPRLSVRGRDGAKWLHCRPPCLFDIVLPEKLPQRYTVDFDYEGADGSNPIQFILIGPDGAPLDGAFQASGSPDAFSYGDFSNEVRLPGNPRRVHFSWVFDGAKAKGYAAGRAALNAGEGPTIRASRVRFEFIGGDDPTLIDGNIPISLANLRIAGGGGQVTFAELSKKGRITLRGILFDTGSDRIRPESTATLAAVAGMLAEHKELKLLVEGHTDDQGPAEANLTLSGKRAAAVKAWLVAKHKADASRLETKGFGQAKPAASNSTDEGRQANRRVELSVL